MPLKGNNTPIHSSKKYQKKYSGIVIFKPPEFDKKHH
jgi:hypothetical protein